MTSTESNITCEGNIAVKSDIILRGREMHLPSDVRVSFYLRGNITGYMTNYYPARDMLSTNHISKTAYEY